MSNVLIYVEAENNSAKKTSLEAVSYGATVAQMLGGKAIALATAALAADKTEELAKYGADKVLHAAQNPSQSEEIAQLIVAAAHQENVTVILAAKSIVVDLALPMVGAKLQASVATNITELPELSNGFVVRRSAYSGKAITKVELSGKIKVLSIKKNASELREYHKPLLLEPFSVEITPSKISVKEVKKQTGEVLLSEADIVVSAGRGLKGPENWGMIEELAKVLGAATACSKPVSDMNWRPHHEHVGQTGIKISPNLYIAIGISGAIQHLAGVNASKVIVVINKDPEAPFFKAADYGIVGDAFEVVPKLTQALKAVL
ncbi:MAG: electron transfer flavoprotein subunit alpha/FixB family protein [Cytophagales bacterium]|nr:electron transfer flavoprotein subunit alpha/FixB family protein [Bernardetiaceae bacterium]MDW8210164.1 electron transfer flavoprotein subunit alpha/FixB family protein [Cytophagales bacterium]